MIRLIHAGGGEEGLSGAALGEGIGAAIDGEQGRDQQRQRAMSTAIVPSV